VLKFILTHTFLVLVTVGLGHGVYRKLYTLIGGHMQKSLRTTAVDKNTVWNLRSRFQFRSNQHEKLLVTYLSNEISLFCYIAFLFLADVTAFLSRCS